MATQKLTTKTTESVVKEWATFLAPRATKAEFFSVTMKNPGESGNVLQTQGVTEFVFLTNSYVATKKNEMACKTILVLSYFNVTSEEPMSVEVIRGDFGIPANYADVYVHVNLNDKLPTYTIVTTTYVEDEWFTRKELNYNIVQLSIHGTERTLAFTKSGLAHHEAVRELKNLGLNPKDLKRTYASK